MKKQLPIILTILLALTAVRVSADDFKASAKHAIIVEAKSGRILFSQNDTKADKIGSLTKLLTAYMVYQAVEDKKISWDENVKISDYAYELSLDNSINNVPLDSRKYTVKQLTEAMLIGSANGASVALAEKVGGTEKDFVDQVRKQLKDWGIKNANIINASGLNNKYLGDNRYPNSGPEEENTMTAKGLALLAYRIVKDYPDMLKMTQKSTASFDDIIEMTNNNAMLENQPAYRYGVNGLKASLSESSGNSMVATSNEFDMSLISVVLQAEDDGTDYPVFNATRDLLSYSVQTFAPHTIIEKGAPYQKSAATIQDGKSKTVSAVTSEDLVSVQDKSDMTTKKATVSLKSGLIAPIKKGTVIGTATLKDKESEKDNYIDGFPSVKLIANSDVQKSNVLKVWWNAFVRYVNEKL